MIKNGKVLIFEQSIKIDKTLPKYKNTEESTQSFILSNNTLINDVSVVGGSSNFFRYVSDGDNVDVNLDYLHYQYGNTKSLHLKFKIWLYKKLYSRNFQIKSNTKRKISLLELKTFFVNIKSNISKLDYKDINEVITKYDSVLSNAKNNNQIALCERIEDYIEVLKNELILTTSKFNKYIDEEDILNFYNKASKHEKYKTSLYLTYVQNFVKMIPEDVSKLKIKADELKVFDNYIIMHYDYTGKSIEDTKEEKEKKKDPILFGVIKNSNKLYYIGDWIDEYCDLTLDVLIKTIGVEEKKLNKETIIDNINKI